MAVPIHKIAESVRDVVQLLVDRDFDELDKLTSSQKCKGTDLARFIDESGVMLALPDDTIFDTPTVVSPNAEADPTDANLVIYETVDPAAWSVELPMWTTEGKSDFTLRLDIFETANDRLRVEVQNLQVL